MPFSCYQYRSSFWCGERLEPEWSQPAHVCAGWCCFNSLWPGNDTLPEPDTNMQVSQLRQALLLVKVSPAVACAHPRTGEECMFSEGLAEAAEDIVSCAVVFWSRLRWWSVPGAVFSWDVAPGLMAALQAPGPPAAFTGLAWTVLHDGGYESSSGKRHFSGQGVKLLVTVVSPCSSPRLGNRSPWFTLSLGVRVLSLTLLSLALFQLHGRTGVKKKGMDV